jgi:hypothetical protein
LPDSRDTVGAVTDQRTPREQLTGTIDQIERVLLGGLQPRGISRLGGGVAARPRTQELHKLVVKCRCLPARPLYVCACASNTAAMLADTFSYDGSASANSHNAV